MTTFSSLAFPPSLPFLLLPPVFPSMCFLSNFLHHVLIPILCFMKGHWDFQAGSGPTGNGEIMSCFLEVWGRINRWILDPLGCQVLSGLVHLLPRTTPCGLGIVSNATEAARSQDLVRTHCVE